LSLKSPGAVQHPAHEGPDNFSEKFSWGGGPPVKHEKVVRRRDALRFPALHDELFMTAAGGGSCVSAATYGGMQGLADILEAIGFFDKALEAVILVVGHGGVFGIAAGDQTDDIGI